MPQEGLGVRNLRSSPTLSLPAELPSQEGGGDRTVMVLLSFDGSVYLRAGVSKFDLFTMDSSRCDGPAIAALGPLCVLVLEEQ